MWKKMDAYLHDRGIYAMPILCGVCVYGIVAFVFSTMSYPGPMAPHL